MYKCCVVIPLYKARSTILKVIENVGQEITNVYVVDDECPQFSGEYVKKNCSDKRVHVIKHDKNTGVGGAVITGYEYALKDGMDIIVKIDADGQMNPRLISKVIAPIINGEADYTKGNRFYNLSSLETMPRVRLFGNAFLSLLSKISTGYWNIFDPTNGFTAIHADIVRNLPLKNISKRFFFETDMLFRLNTLRAVVIDIPMDAVYGNEKSNLKIAKIIPEFMVKHFKNFLKRIFYNYYLRDMSIASLELPLGLLFFIFGVVYGIIKWIESSQTGVFASVGTVMLSTLPIILGIQFLLNFLSYDIQQVPTYPFHKKIRNVSSGRQK